jgi:hypothetical protein
MRVSRKAPSVSARHVSYFGVSVRIVDETCWLSGGSPYERDGG